jgi:hypothetical protein
MKKNIYILSLVYALIIAPVAAQNIIPVKDVKGECFIVNITPEKAKENAILEAKREALNQAGISTNIYRISSERGDKFVQMSNVEVNGEVAEYELVSDEIKILQAGSSKVMVAEVVINAKVVKYPPIPRDMAFKIKVDGFKDHYDDGDKLTFSVLPYKDGYLRIFLFEEDNSGALIFPDTKNEQNRKFKEEDVITFPISKAINYTLSKADRTKNKETNSMLFVYLKDNINYTGKDTSLESVLGWIARITPDKRTEEYVEFTIFRK